MYNHPRRRCRDTVEKRSRSGFEEQGSSVATADALSTKEVSMISMLRNGIRFPLAALGTVLAIWAFFGSTALAQVGAVGGGGAGGGGVAGRVAGAVSGLAGQ